MLLDEERRRVTEPLDLVSEIVRVVREYAVSFTEDSRAALADDAAGKPTRVVALELLLQRLVPALARVVVSQMAADLNAGNVQNSQVCTCGGNLRYKVTRARGWGTLFGELSPDRAYYHCAKCGTGKYPLDVVWGLRPAAQPAAGRDYLTPLAKARLATLAAVVSYGQACKQFVQWTGVSVSAMLAWRTVQRVGKALRAQEAGAGVAVAKGAAPGKGRQSLRWLVSADGIMVGFWRDARRRRRKAGATAIRRRNGIKWREVKVGAIALLNEGGEVVKGSQWYVAGRDKARQFRQALWAVGQARGIRRKDVVAVVTDGAKWLRPIVTRYYTWAVAIRDFFHASEHLKVMGEALHGEGSLRARLWHWRMARRLKRGEIGRMLAQWECAGAKAKDARAWRREFEYFSSQQEAMAYQRFQDAKLPIGSGCIEAGCKVVVAERHKVSGARWTEEGFANLSAVRVWHLNHRSSDTVPPTH